MQAELEGQGERERGPEPALNLLGSHRCTLDDKRRVAVPKPFRDAIAAASGGEQYVVCRELGGDPCLALYPARGFDEALARLEAMRSTTLGVGSKPIRAYLRMVRMYAAPVVPDRQGRVIVPEELCRLAGLTGGAVFVGAGDHAELWAAERLGEGDDQDDFRRVAEQLFG